MDRMPKNRREYEFMLLNAFHTGMTAGYGIEHTNITEEENEAMIQFVKDRKFKTDAVTSCLYERKNDN